MKFVTKRNKWFVIVALALLLVGLIWLIVHSTIWAVTDLAANGPSVANVLTLAQWLILFIPPSWVKRWLNIEERQK